MCSLLSLAVDSPTVNLNTTHPGSTITRRQHSSQALYKLSPSPPAQLSLKALAVAASTALAVAASSALAVATSAALSTSSQRHRCRRRQHSSCRHRCRRHQCSSLYKPSLPQLSAQYSSKALYKLSPPPAHSVALSTISCCHRCRSRQHSSLYLKLTLPLLAQHSLQALASAVVSTAPSLSTSPRRC